MEEQRRKELKKDSKSKIIGIYKITSPSGRIYIGQSRNINKRKLAYKRLDCKSQPKLLNSFEKHGYENHTFEIIEECDFEQLNIRERYWQDFYDVLGEKGMNCLLSKTNELPKVESQKTKEKRSKNMTGENNPMFGKCRELHPNFGKSMPEEQKQKLKGERPNVQGEKSPWFGKKHSEESKQKMSIAKKGKKRNISKESLLKIKERFSGENNPNFGKTPSDETRKKMSEAKKGKIITEEEKQHLRMLSNSIELIDITTGKIFYSLKQASQETNIKYHILQSIFSGKKENTTDLVLLKDFN